MSKDTLTLMKTLDFDSLETRLAIQCAPVLAKLKVSNLLNINISDLDNLYKQFKNTSYSIKVIYSDSKQAYCFIYLKESLIRYLNNPYIQKYLLSIGYHSLEIDDIFKQFSIRFINSRRVQSEFPHEIGFLLGYPIDDVLSYIQKNGEECEYIGYWKVYHNKEKALKMFSLFDYVSEQAIKMVFQKQNLLQLAELPLCTTL